MTDYVIIVAGGVGSRMGTALPKQYLEVGGRPILMRTIDRFLEFNSSFEFRLVLHQSAQELWAELCDKHKFEFSGSVVVGGDERFYSVKNGLDSIDSEFGIVGIHDAVRPFVGLETIERCFDTARKMGNAIPVVPVEQSMRHVDYHGSTSVNRDEYRMVQTPQCFEINPLRDAYKQEYSPLFTDDASVVQGIGVSINLVDGNRQNIKITTKEDLFLANAIIS